MHALELLVTTVLWSGALAAPQSQIPLTGSDRLSSGSGRYTSSKRPLHGRFLHITDFHPDRFYRVYASTSEEAACHRGQGPAGIYGAETSECDSPIALVNQTFAWIEKEFKDKVDFVVWTGDSARHDNDEELPRNAEQVIGLNEFMVAKMAETFGKHNGDESDDDPNNDFVIPIIPTFGNNDILPHNVMAKGPNTWLRTYARVWRQFIPEAQTHQFEQGGWFFAEVIPNKLAVFSLNTLYFFTSNAAANGCAAKSEAGFQQMEWLRIQLQFLRERGMKAILTGHVPPIRQDAKSTWDETCWQKYALWLQQYRDVVITGLYGHFNYDHFMLQDFEHIDEDTKLGRLSLEPSEKLIESSGADEVHAEVSSDYWVQLRQQWAKLPSPPKSLREAERNDPSVSSVLTSLRSFFDSGKKSRRRKEKEENYFRKIGGRYAERFASAYVSASVVPNLYPALRVFEYNITGLERINEHTGFESELAHTNWAVDDEDDAIEVLKKKKHKKPKKTKFVVPDPPSKSSPPGPAYSPQTLSLIKYTQYLANLTHINNDFHASGSVSALKWKEGKHKGKTPPERDQEPNPKPFRFELHYDTQDDDVYQLKDLTMPSLVNLARRIGAFEADASEEIVLRGKCSDDTVNGTSDVDDVATHDRDGGDDDDDDRQGLGINKKKDKKKKKQHRKKKHHHGHRSRPERKVNLPWYTFMRRAFVETKSRDELWEEFGGE